MAPPEADATTRTTGLLPGGWPWLLRHELRLSWRGVGRVGLRGWIGGGVLWGMGHALAAVLLLGARADGLDLARLPALALGTWLMLGLMLSSAMVLALSTLFDRGDLDLLLSSPLPPRRVLVMRTLGNAFTCCALYLLLLAPFAHLGPWIGRPGLLAIYPALAAFGLGSAALGTVLALALVRRLGARRARVATQVLAAFVGAGLFLGLQVPNLLEDDQRRHAAAWLDRTLGPLLVPDSPLWWPAQALLGDVGALAIVGTGALVAMAIVAAWLPRQFLSGTQANVLGRTGGARRARATTPVGRWTIGWQRQLLRKEWRLILRDPNLVSQTLLQLLYLLPLVLLGMRRVDMLSALVPGTVLLAASLAGNLCAITVSAEEAPDLLAGAPVPPGRVRRVKLLAALIPTWVLMLSVVVVLLVQGGPGLAAVCLTCTAAASAAAGLIHLAGPQTADRRDLARRIRTAPAVVALQLVSSLAWAGVAWGLVAGSMLALWPLVPALTVLAWALWRSGR